MRRGFVVGAIFLMFAVAQAIGQTWVTNTGFASDRLLWDQVNYPVISTPMVSLNTVSVSPAGASNATPGNVAGATNATLSITNMGLSSTANMVPPSVPLVSVSGQPTLEGGIAAVAGRHPFVPLAGLRWQGGGRRGPQGMMMARNFSARFLNTGAAVFDDAYSIPVPPENLAQAAAESRAWQQAHPATRVYTNQDIDRIHQQESNRPATQAPQPQ